MGSSALLFQDHVTVTTMRQEVARFLKQLLLVMPVAVFTGDSGLAVVLNHLVEMRVTQNVRILGRIMPAVCKEAVTVTDTEHVLYFTLLHIPNNHFISYQ